MKLSRKILPALAMLLVSAIMLTTASFAWFAMNDEVTAQGMTVNVKTDTVYLLISKDKTTATDIQTEGLTVADKEDDTYTELYPVAHENGEDDPSKNFEAKADSKYTKWYTGKGTSTSDGTLKDGSKSSVSEAEFAEHVLKYNFYVTLAKGSDAATNLRVSEFSMAVGTSGKSDISPVRVIVAADVAGDAGEWQEFSYADNGTVAGGTVLATNLSDTTVVALTVYIYYDGNAANVTTDKFDTLSDAQISFKLTVD